MNSHGVLFTVMGATASHLISPATPADVPSWLALAAEVEPLFGPMVGDPGFLRALRRNIDRGSAFCVRERGASATKPLMGGLLWSAHPPEYGIGWLAVASEHRRLGVGRTLVRHVLSQVPRGSVVAVTTFAANFPGGEEASRFYGKLGFVNETDFEIEPDRQRLVWRIGDSPANE